MKKCTECGISFPEGKGRGSLCRKCYERYVLDRHDRYHKKPKNSKKEALRNGRR